ncbi:MAG: ATP-binding protein [Acidobacteriota bacterium]
MTSKSTQLDAMQLEAQRLGLVGLLEHWHELPAEQREKVIHWEAFTRRQRSLQRRMAAAKLGRFKPMADFDWLWPKQLDRAQVEDLFTLDIVRQGCNAVLIGPNGTGKTMVCKNLVHHAVMAGYTATFIAASDMLRDLAEQPDARTRYKRVKHYTEPDLLGVDEVGYLSYDNRYADLLYEVLNGRYQRKSTIITTNRPFSQWTEVFPNAVSVVTLVDRVTHQAEIVQFVADSYRLKEATEQRQLRAAARAKRTDTP